MQLDFTGLETVYEDMARALDDAGAANRELFLCKLCLMLARDSGDAARVQEMIRQAKRHLGAH